MADPKREIDSYLGTIERLEPEIAPIDASAFFASASISLKRIADMLQSHGIPAETKRSAFVIFQQADGTWRCVRSEGAWQLNFDQSWPGIISSTAGSCALALSSALATDRLKE